MEREGSRGKSSGRSQLNVLKREILFIWHFVVKSESISLELLSILT